ncbi:MAG: FrgA protein [Myxococcaceae bacterium]
MPSRLAEHLVARGLLNAQHAAEALRLHAEGGLAFDDVVLQNRWLPEASLLHALAEISGVRSVNLTEFEPNVEMAALLPAKIAERLGVVPLSLDSNTLHIASAFPIHRAELDEIGFLLSKGIVFWIAPRIRVRSWMAKLYGTPLQPGEQQLLSQLATPQDASAPVPVPATAVVHVEGQTLEDRLVREMVDQGPAHRAREPILLAQPKTRAPTQTGVPVAREAPTLLTTPAVNAPIATLQAARDLLKTETKTREALLDVVLRFGLSTFDFVAAFAVIRGVAAGWAARGEGATPHQIATLSVPLDAASVFRTVALTHSSYLGPVPQDPLTKGYLGHLGRAPRMVFLFPVEVRGRIVAMLYGDGGEKPLSQRRASDFILFCQELPSAFERLILTRRQAGAPAALADDELHAPSPTQASWSPSDKSEKVTPGRAATREVRTQSENERPPPDFEPILRRLTGPDAAQRARAMAELARSPVASSRVLCQRFPGPTGWAQSLVVELPEADELGPIPGALSRLGRPAAQALSALLDAEDVTVRYFALLTAGSLPYAELVPGLLRGIFDSEPNVSSAARAASTTFRHLTRFDASMRELRQELAAINPTRRSLAARALGALHDREAIDGLIGLTASDDNLCAQAAAAALSEITLTSHGLNTQMWRGWWAENRARRRAEWLVAALRSPKAELRGAAIDELASVTGDRYGFSPDAAQFERDAALKRWETALIQDPRLRRLD